MVDGFYKAAFATPAGAGGGVVFLSGGTVKGGDSALYYQGTYALDGSQFSATIYTNRHSPGMGSVFGTDKVEISLTGTVSGNDIDAKGRSPQAPGLAFNVKLTRLP